LETGVCDCARCGGEFGLLGIHFGLTDVEKDGSCSKNDQLKLDREWMGELDYMRGGLWRRDVSIQGGYPCSLDGVIPGELCSMNEDC
jgi:hypothetical protein